MDKKTILLVGIVDTLTHVLQNDAAARKGKGARAACKRLEGVRKQLLSEGLRYSQIVGAARDTVFEVSTQLDAQLSGQADTRSIQWIVQGLLFADIQDVEPPPLPSSSNGPKSATVELTRLAEAIVETARLSDGPRETNRLTAFLQQATEPSNPSKNGRKKLVK